MSNKKKRKETEERKTEIETEVRKKKVAGVKE